MFKQTLVVYSLLLIHCLLGGAQTNSQTVWPQPKTFTQEAKSPIIINPCSFDISFLNFDPLNLPSQLNEITTIYKNIIFNTSLGQSNNHFISLLDCDSKLKARQLSREEEKESQQSLIINIYNWDLSPNRTIENEWYNLSIASGNPWTIYANAYTGLVRALETFSQLVSYNISTGEFSIQNNQIFIEDQPDFNYRGVLIDTARHYLQKATILKTLDGMMHNKLNVLHWHIVDAESFPLQLDSRPELSLYGAYSATQIYTKTDIQEIVAYAHLRGVYVMPEIDTPGHTASWFYSPTLSGIGVCPAGIKNVNNCVMDPTNALTFEVVSDVITEINELFPDSLVHFGGDEVVTSMWDDKPSIKQWMKANSITSYTDLEIYYREKVRNMWTNLTTTKQVVYWANPDINLALQPSDIIQWWGTASDLSQVASYSNQLILSNSESLYINYNQYTWQQVYAFDPNVKIQNFKPTVIGAEASLWGEGNNDNTHENHLWMRASAFSERVWNSNANEIDDMSLLVFRLSSFEQILSRRGFRTSPVDTEWCVQHSTQCYPQSGKSLKSMKE